MDAPAAVYGDVVVGHVLEDVLDVAGDFFTAFEAEIDGSFNVVLSFKQDLCGSQQHPHVSVVSAGMHDSIVL